MRKHKEFFLSCIIHSCDFIILGFSLFIADIISHPAYYQIISILFPFIFFNLQFGRYKNTLYLPFKLELYILFKNTIFAFLFNWVTFSLIISPIPYYKIFFFHSLYLLGLVTFRPIFHFLIHEGPFKNKGLRNVTIIGDISEKSKEVTQVIEKFRILKYNIIHITQSDTDLVNDISNKNVFEVFYFLNESNHHQLKNIVPICQTYGVRLRIFIDFQQRAYCGNTKLLVDSIGGIDSFIISNIPEKYLKLKIKRFIDIIFGFSFILLFSPILILVSILIKLTSPGPIIYSQIRSGQYGKKFKMYKFRTMIVDAEQFLDKLKEQNEMDGPVFKIKTDPRITKIGKVLRKWSIDELPQLFNVLKGELSLVGARPPIPKEVEQYTPWQMRRLSMPPGLTCFWQISGRSNISFEKWMELDLKYIDNWSLFLDFKILLKTIPAVLKAKGSY